MRKLASKAHRLQAHAARAFGADYIANILRQQLIPREVQPPLRLRDPALNELATDPLSLAEYDGFILRSRKESRISLHQKLNQLSLTSMARQLDQVMADAAARNLRLAQTLESLADLELEARNSRSIERRFRISRLEYHALLASVQHRFSQGFAACELYIFALHQRPRLQWRNQRFGVSEPFESQAGSRGVHLRRPSPVQCFRDRHQSQAGRQMDVGNLRKLAARANHFGSHRSAHERDDRNRQFPHWGRAGPSEPDSSQRL